MRIIKLIEISKRVFCIIVFLNLYILCHAQIIEAQVLDANTRKPLTYAEVLSSNGDCTITNSDGFFEINISASKQVEIRYLGYLNRIIAVDAIPNQILLQPIDFELSPAIAIGVDTDTFIRNLYKKYYSLSKLLKKRKTDQSVYFYRQTTIQDDECIELIESFFQAEPLMALSEMKVINGRYAKAQVDTSTSHFTSKNFFSLSEAAFFSRDKRTTNKQFILPLTPRTQEYYDINVQLFSNNNELSFFAIHFSPKNEYINYPMITATIYVDADSFNVYKYEGAFNMPVEMKSENLIALIPTKFQIEYDSSSGIPIVNKINVSSSHVFEHPSLGLIHSSVSSLLFKVSDSFSSLNASRIGWRHSLVEKIKSGDYDPSFWENNPVVKRTELEEHAIKMFESNNTIGTYKL